MFAKVENENKIEKMKMKKVRKRKCKCKLLCMKLFSEQFKNEIEVEIRSAK